ncbi:MFS transporter [Pseudomonas sp. PDM16]|uniref:MFS transporter n=1 Tax=Pseudomonas sp. PDM16 TaxID=2769292 RepID=UPI00178427A2|nr:MFS transporter [Pseudomonas sp. PDM16]MBD9416898.1 MFS transporter [Pseudomonas sp. PDM16]
MSPRYLLGVLIFAVSVVGLSMGATLPLVALRLHEAGAGSLTIGALSALPAAGMILAALLTNRLSQRFSGRQLYLACFTLCLFGVVALLPEQPPLPLLAIARLLLGVGMGVLVILGESWVNELCDERKRGQIVALYAACFTGCQLGGPAMISLFGAASAWPVWLVLATNLIALALVWRSLPADLAEDTENAPRRFSLLGFVRVAPALCLGVLFFAFFDAVVLSLFPVYASGHGYAVAVAALMASVILAGDMLFQVPLGWLSDRLDRRALHLACGMLTLGLGVALPWLIEQPDLLWPALMLLGAAAGGIYTLALVLIGHHFRGPDLVTANACVGMLWGVGSLLGPLLSGALMDIGPQGLPLAMCLAASLFVVAALGALPAARRAFS